MLDKSQISILNRIQNVIVADYTNRATELYCCVCILIKKGTDLEIKVRQDLKVLKEDFSFEISAIEILKFNTIVISIYRTPYNVTLKPFLSKLEKLLSKLNKNNKKKIIITTDCNIDVLNELDT